MSVRKRVRKDDLPWCHFLPPKSELDDDSSVFVFGCKISSWCKPPICAAGDCFGEFPYPYSSPFPLCVSRPHIQVPPPATLSSSLYHLDRHPFIQVSHVYRWRLLFCVRLRKINYSKHPIEPPLVDVLYQSQAVIECQGLIPVRASFPRLRVMCEVMTQQVLVRDPRVPISARYLRLCI